MKTILLASALAATLALACPQNATDQFQKYYDNRAELVKERNVAALLAQMTLDYTIRHRRRHLRAEGPSRPERCTGRHT